MRRTIASLMFLVMGGLVTVAAAANPSRGDSSGYYASGAAAYSLSDDGEESAAPASAGLAPARVGASTRPEKTALYVDHGLGGYDHQQVGYYSGGGGESCSTGCNSGCCSSNWACGNDCDCVVNTFRFEYLMWFTHGRNTPPLVTTGGTEGVIGEPGTTILFGNYPITDGLRSGARLTFSHLFSDGCTYGDVRFWGLEDGSDTFSRTSDGDPLLAVPFFNAGTGQNDSLILAAPGIATNGSVSIRSKNDLLAADAWFRRILHEDCCDRVDLLAGYMFTRLDDSLTINTATTNLFGGIPPGTTVSSSDSFRTQNEFHGAQLGFVATAKRGVWDVELLGKVALGDMRQAVIINGRNTVTPPGGTPQSSSGGLFALSTNSGSFERHRLAFVPEVNLNLIYNINPCWRVMGGYSFVYWSNVVLAGNQIDPALNRTQTSQLQGPAFPRTTFARTDFWAQGMSLGAEYRW